MVQLKRDLPDPTSGKPDNTYWAVGDRLRNVQDLEQGFKKKSWVDQISERVTARVVTDRFNLQDRGLLNYERCTIAELETFIKARRLNLPGEETYHVPDPTRVFELRDTRDRPHRSQERAQRLEATRAKAQKAAYIAALHRADDAVVFDKFEELPAELRTTVYKMYHNDLSALGKGSPKTLPELPYQPPLTLISRKFREEVLPSFYEDSTFVLRLFVETKSWIHGQRPKSVVSLHNTADDPDLLTSANLRPTALARMSHLRLRLEHLHHHRRSGSRRTYNDGECVSWYIDLNGKEGPVVKSDWFCERHWTKPYWVARRERMELAVLRVLREVAKRSKAHRLRRGDLVDLQEAVREALNPPADA